MEVRNIDRIEVRWTYPAFRKGKARISSAINEHSLA